MRGIPSSRTRWLLAAAVVALTALPRAGYAQRFTGDLSGTVTDESGAVIPGANVTLTNENSKDQRRTVTNEDGFFAFAAVPAGTYTVGVQLQGFRPAEVRGVQLRAGDSRSLRTINLGVAGLEESVSVTADVPIVPLNSGEKSATLVAEQIENIPTVGRSAAELLKILPGLTPVTQGVTNRPGFTGEVIGINGNGEYQGGGGNNQSAIGNFSGNGTRTDSLDITIDGAPGADPGCNCATSVNPNPEMTQEFKVLQSNFGAEHAKGPVAMSVVSKAGGREFHGTLYNYFRDYHLNSNEWFANKIGNERIKNRFFFPGGNLSGPLLIPGTGFNKNRDKAFFFLGFEYFGQRLDTGYVKSWVPTAAMRNGDFSQAPNLGLGGGADMVTSLPNGFPGGIIPPSQIDPGGRALLNVFPLPNADPRVTGGFNYVDNLLIDQNGTQALARLDLNISETTKMFLRYNRQRETQPFVIGLWWRNGERQVPYPSSISAANRSDSATASLTHIFNPTLTSETIFAVTYIDFPNAIDDRNKISRQALGYPYNGVFGAHNDQIPSVDAGGWGNGGPLFYNPGGFDPVLFATKWQISALNNVTKVTGGHTMKFGLYWEHVTNNQPGNGDSNGLIELANWGGNSTGNTFADLLLGRVANYQETSKNVLHNIAYNLFEGYAQDSWKLRPRLTVDFGARVSYIGPWYDREGVGLAAFDRSRYSPTAPSSEFPGVVWTARDSSVPLSGVDLGVFVTPRVGFAWDARGTGDTVVRGGFGMYRYHEPQSIYAGLIDVGAGFRNIGIGAATTLRELDAVGGGNPVFNGDTIDINDDKQPISYSWSATVNQRLPWSMNIEAGYVGNRSDNLLNTDVANYNAVPIGAMINDPNGDPNRYRPLPNYGGLDVFRHSVYQNYNGFQALLSRQRGRFNFTAAYTFSKALGVRSGGQGPALASEYAADVRKFNYGILSTDRTHVATASYSLLLPEPAGGAAKAILGGWQIAGISTYISGAPLQAFNNTNFGMTGTLAGGLAIQSSAISGSPDIPAQPVLTCDPTENIPSGYMFNPSCFAAPTPGTNGAYIFPYVKGQPYFNHDLSLFKNFQLGGQRRLQLRLSAYNFLNHPIRFPDVGRNLTLRFANGQRDDPNGDFGRLPEDNKFGRRIVQLAARFSF
jgi:carboxypeptidase family protein